MTTALYPGSFDPITHGHLNIIQRGLKVFDKLIVSVAHNVSKTGFFSVDERIEMLNEVMGDDSRIQVTSFHGLLVDYAAEQGATVILRGLRAVSDFEYEFQMAHMNHKLKHDIETVFMMTGEEHFYVSSKLVREVATFGGDIKSLVPPAVHKRLLARLVTVGDGNVLCNEVNRQ